MDKLAPADSLHIRRRNGGPIYHGWWEHQNRLQVYVIQAGLVRIDISALHWLHQLPMCQLTGDGLVKQCAQWAIRWTKVPKLHPLFAQTTKVSGAFCSNVKSLNFTQTRRHQNVHNNGNAMQRHCNKLYSFLPCMFLLWHFRLFQLHDHDGYNTRYVCTTLDRYTLSEQVCPSVWCTFSVQYLQHPNPFLQYYCILIYLSE